MDRVKLTALFVAGFAFTAAVAMAVSVYGFDQYERAWGRAGSYQVVLCIIVAAAVVNALGFVLGSNTIRATLRWWGPLILGIVFTLVFAALATSVAYFGLDQDLRLLILALFSFAASFLAAKLLAVWMLSANRRPQTDAGEAGAAGPGR